VLVVPKLKLPLDTPVGGVTFGFNKDFLSANAILFYLYINIKKTINY
jgi:hypothetical protein